MSLDLNIKVDISEATQDLQAFSGILHDQLTLAIDESVKDVKETVIKDYSVGAGRGFTTRTGRLRSSITAWVEEQSGKTVGIVSAGVDYDKYVELLWGGKYAYMLPALMDNLDNITNNVINAIIFSVDRL